MKFLVIEKSADGALDIAVRAKALRHEVRYHLAQYDQHKVPVGRGMVERVNDWRSSMRWADLVFVGGNDHCQLELDRWRQQGVKIVGSSVDAAIWESDRELGMRVFRKAGIPIPPYRAFTSYDDAISYVKKRGEPLVSKPSGRCDDKTLSYVSKSAEDLIYMLERWKRSGKRAGQEFILQEKVSGVEFAVGAWFGPGGFVPEWEENFEHKKLFPGDLGPNTGEMGTVSRWVKRSKLADKVLKPLEDQLARTGFVGCIDVSVIVDDEGVPWPLEFTTRGGWPALNLECENFDCDFVEFWHELASGKTPKGAHRLDEVVAGVVLALPDFPYSHATRKEVVGIPAKNIDHRHWHPAQMMVEDGQDRTAGDYLGIMCGTGATVSNACSKTYARLKRIEMPGSPFWRNDIGLRLKKGLPALQRQGYAAGMEY